MLRVNNGVLVVPPFECAWLTGEVYTLRSGSGCLSFEAKGDTDVTVILKSTPGAKRLQPLLRQQAPSRTGGVHGGGGNAFQVEQNYTIIFGSHRNSCLKIEKNGVTQCMVSGVACSRVSSKAFSKYWIDLNHGLLTVGHGEPGQGVCHQWRDSQEIPGIQHIGLSCWDRHVSYRSIALQPPLDFTRLQQQQQQVQLTAGGAAGTGAVPSLFDATCAALMAATTPANVCRTLHVAELLLPTTQKLYRYCLDFIAIHLEAVVRLTEPYTGPSTETSVRSSADPLVQPSSHSSVGPSYHLSINLCGVSQGRLGPHRGLRSVSPAAMCDLVCQNMFSVDEQGIFAAVHDWACAHITAAAASDAAEEEPGPGAGKGQRAAGRSSAGGVGPGERSCRMRMGSPVGASSHAPCFPVAPAGPRPRLSDPSSSGSAAGAVPPPNVMTGIPPGVPGGGVTFGPGGGRRNRTPSHADLAAALDLMGVSGSSCSSGMAMAPGTPVRRLPTAAAGSAAAAVAEAPSGSSSSAQAEEAACRVLGLIRFPLLPIPQLHACLRDPLLRRLPPVLELVHEALEVHRRETGADGLLVAAVERSGPEAGSGQEGRLESGSLTGVATAHAPHPHGGGEGAGTGPPLAATGMLSPSPGRRLVTPLAAGAAATGGGVAAAGHGCGLDVAAGGVAPPGSGGVAAASGDSSWSVRYQRRCLPFALELMYVCDGDSCGVLHFLGTSYGVQGWVNPLLAKRVDVRASSPTGRTTDPRVVVGRQFVRTNFAGPRYVNGAAVSWWQVDLGEQHQLAITYYTLRHDGSQDFVRSWVLQGSLDLVNWVDLKRHSHDTSIKLPGQYASWPIIGPAAAVPYRAFRLLLTAPNASPNPASRHNFCLSNLELYGFLHKGTVSAGSSGSSSIAGTAVVPPSAGGGGGFGATAAPGAAWLPPAALAAAVAVPV